jgi:hypothetical protein
VEYVLEHAVGDEGLAVGVEVQTEGVDRAVGDDFEHVLRRVVAPDAAIELDAIAFRGPGLADDILRLDAAQSPQPSIRPPVQVSEDVMPAFMTSHPSSNTLAGPVGFGSSALKSAGMNLKYGMPQT